MRASVAAQGRCSRKLLPKSLNCRATPHQNDRRAAASYVSIRPWRASRRGSHRSPCVLRGRQCCPPAGTAIAASRAPTTLIPSTSFRTAQFADLPRSVAVNRGAAAAFDNRAEAVHRGDESLVAAGKGGQLVGLAGPSTARAGANDIAVADRRRDERGRERQPFDRRRHHRAEHLQSFVVEPFLMRLPRNLSLFLSCTV